MNRPIKIKLGLHRTPDFETVHQLPSATQLEKLLENFTTMNGPFKTKLGTHRSPGLEAVHEGQHLGHNAPLNFAVSLVSLRSDRINLIDKDNGGGVLLRLLGFSRDKDALWR